MRRNLLIVLTGCLLYTAVLAQQCDPLDHNFGKAAFGVSPDPQLGENFADAYLDQPYTDVVYVLAPMDAGDIDPSFAGLGVTIDSLRLDDILLFNGVEDVSLSTIGLELTCNNVGDAVDPCTFLGGNVYCGDISGTPSVAGVFPVKILVTGYVDFFGPQAIPYEFDNYSLTIIGDVSVAEEEVLVQSVNLSQNSPNPVASFTSINFDLAMSGDADFTVINLVGDKVFAKKLNGKRGVNSFRFDASELENGVYLYSISSGDKKFTRRLIVQH